MKKLALSIVAVLVAITTVFGLTACGETPEQKLKSYIESDTVQEQISSMTSSFESMLDIDVKAEGEKVVFDFTYKTQIDDATLETVKSQLETAFDSLASTFESMANQIKKEVGIENATVVININNADGTNIVNLEYKATE
ncbi:DUF4854 domain-containing protein [Ruminococcus sp.]|uniref:DUF4854 domain-containing protein n=1 Tax=Ruminococcus sp. TaxID=41978 RepID=UPI00262F71AA|nr:DUF4854 domain-containing protein [Ruminococcus sp.]MDD6988612.1 DUF4854 domain-containing protein [Ruminococcus sp.]MDY6201417.1 DUF4854 domain-containing protein [Ruminococcus sp.]